MAWNDKKDGKHYHVYYALAIGVFWALTYCGSLATHDYTGFSLATPVMLMAAGYFLNSGMRNGK